jgi:hypothetical protein
VYHVQYSTYVPHSLLKSASRIRHIKCDERRPACDKCVRAKRKCLGYPSLETERLSKGLAVSVFNDDSERSAFAFFQTFTARDLTGDIESGFWTRLVLQGSHVSDALHHAVIALGALHQSVMIRRGLLGRPGDRSDRSLLALKHYVKALAAARRSLDNLNELPITIMICCAVFCSFETLQTHMPAAATHIQGGLAIFSSQVQQDRGAWMEMVMKYDIPNVLVRQAFQLVCAHAEPLRSNPMVGQIQSMDPLRVAKIRNVAEARDALFTCFSTIFFEPGTAVDKACSTNEESFIHEYSVAKCAQLVIYGGRNKQFAVARDKVVTAFNEWEYELSYFFDQNAKSLSKKELRACTLLRVHHSAVILLLSYSRDNGLMEFQDPFPAGHSYEQLLSWVKSLLASDDTMEELSAFNPDLGVVPPLFMIAANSADEAVQNEATEILESKPRIEGTWDSAEMLAIIKGLREKEGRKKKSTSESARNQVSPTI